MKKQIYRLIVIFVIFITSVISLKYYLMPNNGFTRSFTRKEASLKSSIFIATNPYIITSLTPDSISLFRSTVPNDVLRLSILLNQSRKYTINFHKKDTITEGTNLLRYQGSNIYLLTGNNGTIYRKELKTGRITSSRVGQFDYSEVINHNTFLIVSRVVRNDSIIRIIKKIDFKGNVKNTYFPEKQVDGYFCTDGLLKYDLETRRIIYSFAYRGEFVCLDTNLNEIYKAKTIDTIRRTKLRIAKEKVKVKGGYLEYITQATPPHIVNRNICINNNKLYVHSLIKSNNEDIKDFSKSDVIDAYNLQDGHYLYSFRVLKTRYFDKLWGIQALGDRLLAVYSNRVTVYSIPVKKN